MTSAKAQLMLSLLLVSSIIAAQQTPSQRNNAEFRFADGKTVRIEYGQLACPSPQSGDALPYGKVWATGAGRATSLTTDVAIQIDEVVLPPGTYSIYTVPSAGEWTLILNQKSGQPASLYPEGWDFAHVKMRRRSLTKPVEQFTILFSSHGADGGAMKLRWGLTEVWVNFQEQLNPDQGEGDAS